ATRSQEVVAMWAFFSARLRIWLLLTIGAPILAWVLGKLGDLVEARHGPNGLSKVLQKCRGWLRSRSRGPFARRLSADARSTTDPDTPVR
ncbi:MAG: hypothetical protein ACRDRK_26515, partial [Pseudonocardia sp.]